jgi:hypothetical protein
MRTLGNLLATSALALTLAGFVACDDRTSSNTQQPVIQQRTEQPQEPEVVITPGKGFDPTKVQDMGSFFDQLAERNRSTLWVSREHGTPEYYRGIRNDFSWSDFITENENEIDFDNILLETTASQIAGLPTDSLDMVFGTLRNSDILYDYVFPGGRWWTFNSMSELQATEWDYDPNTMEEWEHEDEDGNFYVQYALPIWGFYKDELKDKIFSKFVRKLSGKAYDLAENSARRYAENESIRYRGVDGTLNLAELGRHLRRKYDVPNWNGEMSVIPFVYQPAITCIPEEGYKFDLSNLELYLENARAVVVGSPVSRRKYEQEIVRRMSHALYNEATDYETNSNAWMSDYYYNGTECNHFCGKVLFFQGLRRNNDPNRYYTVPRILQGVLSKARHFAHQGNYAESAKVGDFGASLARETGHRNFISEFNTVAR